MKATEQYYTVVLVIMLYKGGSNFWLCGWNPSVWPFKGKLTEQFFPVVLFIMHPLIHLKINKIFFSIYAIFILYSGQPLHICNMQLSWKASWTNRNDGTSRLHCGLLWGNPWYVIKIHIEILRTALHTFLFRIVERVWFGIKVFSLWSSI